MKASGAVGSKDTSGIDWSALLDRQEAAQAALGAERSLNAESERALLASRAARLAERPPEQTDPAGCLDCLEFQLSGESYALEMSYVSETLPLVEFTPLFCTPPFVLGITGWRGRIISILDLRRFFELPAPGLSDLNRVIVVGNAGMEFGVLADAVVGMRSLSPAELMPAPATFAGIREEFLYGVTADRLALLDLGKILADQRVVVRDE